MVRMSTTDDWSALSDEHRRYEAKRMAVYGAMVEAMDHHLGRLFEYLKSDRPIRQHADYFHLR